MDGVEPIAQRSLGARSCSRIWRFHDKCPGLRCKGIQRDHGSFHRWELGLSQTFGTRTTADINTYIYSIIIHNVDNNDDQEE